MLLSYCREITWQVKIKYIQIDTYLKQLITHYALKHDFVVNDVTHGMLINDLLVKDIFYIHTLYFS